MQVEEAQLEAAEIGGSSAEAYKEKLEILEHQEELIAEELEEEQKIKESTSPSSGITKEDLSVVSEVVSTLASNNPMELAKSELDEIKNELQEFKEVHTTIFPGL